MRRNRFETHCAFACRRDGGLYPVGLQCCTCLGHYAVRWNIRTALSSGGWNGFHHHADGAAKGRVLSGHKDQCDRPADTGDGIGYTTWYRIETYQPLSDSEEDVRLAAEAFDSAKPDPVWQSDDPVFRPRDRQHAGRRALPFPTMMRPGTFAWEYTLGRAGGPELHRDRGELHL